MEMQQKSMLILTTKRLVYEIRKVLTRTCTHMLKKIHCFRNIGLDQRLMFVLHTGRAQILARNVNNKTIFFAQHTSSNCQLVFCVNENKIRASNQKTPKTEHGRNQKQATVK